MDNQDLKQEVTDKYSLRGRVFHRIREDILNGKYKDHEELKEVAIGQELGVSRTPVREAFRQLDLKGSVQDGHARILQKSSLRKWKRTFILLSFMLHVAIWSRWLNWIIVSTIFYTSHAIPRCLSIF
jgi:DNA-binding transcriptional MocR family regulator